MPSESLRCRRCTPSRLQLGTSTTSRAGSPSASATPSSTAASPDGSTRRAGASPADAGLSITPNVKTSNASAGDFEGSRDEMTELTIRPDEIRDALEQYVQAYEPEAASREEVGRVTETGDGSARVRGL